MTDASLLLALGAALLVAAWACFNFGRLYEARKSLRRQLDMLNDLERAARNPRRR